MVGGVDNIFPRFWLLIVIWCSSKTRSECESSFLKTDPYTSTAPSSMGPARGKDVASNMVELFAPLIFYVHCLSSTQRRYACLDVLCAPSCFALGHHNASVCVIQRTSTSPRGENSSDAALMFICLYTFDQHMGMGQK